MFDYKILKKFGVEVHPHRAIMIKEVLWVPPIGNWVKANTDEASNSTTSTCGWLFRNHQDEFIGGFAENLGSHNALYTEMSSAFKAIELAH